ncbi:uncharacterized protein LOC122033868 [Zingiber officinale]|uniref:uncharacterized protein LOC122033868 n=1 Tax=Zingiber officinale TaxID=94328 RepID=UPI001C4B226C|nr:uncharacterized protein LOC122033868 [Zingiber officinale]
MSYDAFTRLVAILRGRGLLRDNQYSFVEEQVAKFLHILSGQGRVRSESFFFRRSTETISRHFHKVLRALITLQDQFLVQPNGSTVSPQILNSGGRFYPYFKNCIGAIDGTHIRVKVSKEDVSRYRGRKNYPTMNVLAACTFDLKFMYVLPGWEGSASDSRILDNALSREDNLNAPQGKFYLADAGYMLRSTFLTPYRSTRYHLKEYSRHPPENPKELFNLRHSSLRNAIERAFGVLKNRFPILAEMSRYNVETYIIGGDMDAEKVFEVGGNDCNAYFKWTTEMDGVMLEVLREQKSKGQKEDRAFSAEVYRKVVEEINDKFSLNINKTKVMNRLKTLKEQMVLSKEIELKSRIGWNDSFKTFEAPLEVWKSLIKANPRYKNIKGKSLHHLEILREIYEKDVATGAQAESAREKVQRWEREETHITIDEIDEMQANNHVYLDKFSTFDFEIAKGKKRKAPMTNEYSSQLNEVSSAMKDIAQAILNTNTQVWKPAEIYEAVAKLGLEVDKLFEAVELLNEHPNLIGVFFGFPEELRLQWLAKKLSW